MSNDAQPVSILLIDDDEDDGFIFGHALKEIDRGITYIYQRDSELALRQLKSFTLNPDYIFLDLNMPKVNGLEVLRELKKVKRLWHIPIIIYSTTKNKEHVDCVMNLGASNFVTKPNSVTEIKAAVMKILNATKNRT